MYSLKICKCAKISRWPVYIFWGNNCFKFAALQTWSHSVRISLVDSSVIYNNISRPTCSIPEDYQLFQYTILWIYYISVYINFLHVDWDMYIPSCCLEDCNLDTHAIGITRQIITQKTIIIVFKGRIAEVTLRCSVLANCWFVSCAPFKIRSVVSVQLDMGN